MRTITIDIINDKALNLLQDLESLKLIRFRKDEPDRKSGTTDWTKYKGAMSKQSPEDIDRQLSDLRNEWE